MNALQKQELAAKAQYEEAKKLNELYSKLHDLVKKDFGSLEKFIAKIEASKGTPAKPAAKARKSKPNASSGKITRKRITDAQLKKMKTLRAKDVPQEEVAKKVGCSTSAVGLWEGKDFKRPKK